MLTFVKLAWRNLFRNKRRTTIAGIAIGIGLAALIFVDALVIGMEDNMVKSATSSFLGEGQIHRKGFRQTQEVDKTINQLDAVASSLKKDKIVENFTLRTLSFAVITSPANVSSISLAGVNPSTEKHLSQIDDAIVEGSFFEAADERALVIGDRLAALLEVGLGDRVVITVAQARTGDLAQEMFRVSGVFHLNVREMDGGMAFIKLNKAQEMLALGNDIHEIAIKFTKTKFGEDKNLPLWQKYSQYGNEAVGWTELLPQLQAAFELSQFSTYLAGLILFGVVALGITNTLFMSLHERLFEFGVLRAIGTRPFRMAQLIIFEAASLGILSIALGIILGFAVTYITSRVGIDYRGIEFAGVTFQELLFPAMKAKQFITYPFWVFVFTTIIGIYPAVYAAKMSPADALRKSF